MECKVHDTIATEQCLRRLKNQETTFAKAFLKATLARMS